MTTSQTFECPNCRGPLDSKGGEKTVVCPFCGTKVIVPKELRAEEAPEPAQTPVVISFSPTTRSVPAASYVGPQASRGRRWLVAAIVLVSVCVFGVIMLVSVGAPLGLTIGLMGSLSETFSEEVVQTLVPTLGQGSDPSFPTEPAPVGFASPVLTFGSEGIGQGQFTDARHIALDGQGNVYVGEYSDGRVQRFDASGNFLALWMVGTELPLRGLAADRNGMVYVVQGGQILRYEGPTGTLLGPLDYAEGRGFDDVAVTADGGLVAAWYQNRDDIVHFDSSGSVVLTVPQAISGQSGDSELDTRVAVDGLGNIYALGHFNNAVFKFTPDGHYVNRFGGEGDEPGQLRAPHSIAADGQGRVYVGDFNGIQVFDADGRYVARIEVDGVVFGMAFNDQNELYVAARDHVAKYVLNASTP